MTPLDWATRALDLVLEAHNLSEDANLTDHLEGAIQRLTELGAEPSLP